MKPLSNSSEPNDLPSRQGLCHSQPDPDVTASEAQREPALMLLRHMPDADPESAFQPLSATLLSWTPLS